MRALAAWIPLLVLPLGCLESETVTASDVVVLASCPAGFPCDEIADGRSVVTVQACVPEKAGDLAKDLKAVFRLSEGQWLNGASGAAAGEIQLDVGVDRCATPSFRTGTGLGPVRIDATIAGEIATEFVPLAPARIETLELAPQPVPFVVGGSNRLTVTARSAGGGKPSQGTELGFAVTGSAPPGGAFVFPENAAVDANGAAATSVLVVTGTTSVTLAVTATPPLALDGTLAAPLSAEVTVRVGP